jgi:alpha-N-arabinofuranosidase
LGLVAPRADFNPRLFGAFLEHLGRSVYTGVYDPGNSLSDERGFRKDVIKEVADLHVPIIRYPGGNMVSGYNWWDGVGPKKDRPTVLERAWNSLETNQFGTNDFMEWAKAVGTEPLLGFNLGTGSSEMAVAYIEYCNYAKGTKWSELRRSHGYDQPHKVKYWCLGNEMDGPWQMGRLEAREYGRKARDIAQQARVIDPDVQLIACGSSNTILPTYLKWDREVLEECYDQVDGISLHNYFGNEPELAGGKSERFLAQNLDMERQILEITAVADYVQGLYRSPKKLWLSFDEWNVWYRARTPDHLDGKGKFAPHLLEEVYNLEDALLNGGFLNTLMRQSDRVRVACLAQIVNVIAPLVTNSKGTLRQSIYYPYQMVLSTRAAACSTSRWRARPIRSAPRACAPTSRATKKCRSSMWWRLTTRRKSALPCSPSIATSPMTVSSRSTSRTSRRRRCWLPRRSPDRISRRSTPSRARTRS